MIHVSKHDLHLRLDRPEQLTQVMKLLEHGVGSPISARPSPNTRS